jgi:glucan phosphoethanolaminetransferase (alkaline phosphatase superfamily)
MEAYKLKNPFVSLTIPVFGILSFLCVYPQLNKAFYLLIIPIVLLILGSYIFYKKMTYRIIIDDSTITIAKRVIPWNKVQKIIEYKQMIENGSGIRKVTKLAVVYKSNDNKSKTVNIVPKAMDKPVAIINSLKKRIEITKI